MKFQTYWKCFDNIQQKTKSSPLKVFSYLFTRLRLRKLVILYPKSNSGVSARTHTHAHESRSVSAAWRMLTKKKKDMSFPSAGSLTDSVIRKPPLSRVGGSITSCCHLHTSSLVSMRDFFFLNDRQQPWLVLIALKWFTNLNQFVFLKPPPPPDDPNETYRELSRKKSILTVFFS